MSPLNFCFFFVLDPLRCDLMREPEKSCVSVIKNFWFCKDYMSPFSSSSVIWRNCKGLIVLLLFVPIIKRMNLCYGHHSDKFIQGYQFCFPHYLLILDLTSKFFFLLSFEDFILMSGMKWENTSLDRKGCKKILFHCISSSLISMFMLSNRMSPDVNSSKKIARKYTWEFVCQQRSLCFFHTVDPPLKCKSRRISLLFCFLSF